jgi:hypothetical protein
VDRSRKASTIRNGNILLLIYIVSLTIQSVIGLTINNRCTDIELTSPIHFIKDATCYIQFPQQLKSNRSIMEAKFAIGIDRNAFGGALLYHLKRKEDASISTQLLIIWGYDHFEMYLHIWLVEHESTLVWNEDKLKRLHNAYRSQYSIRPTMKTWLLHDNIRLMTYVGSPDGCCSMSVIISETEGHGRIMRPLRIDPSK